MSQVTHSARSFALPIIRPALPSDVTTIDAFDSFAGDRAREASEGRMLVAEVERALVAYVSWAPAGLVGRDYITFLCVDALFRRTGLGAALLRVATTVIGAGRLYISTEEDNAPMLTLLSRERWIAAGAITDINTNGAAERFFYKDI